MEQSDLNRYLNPERTLAEAEKYPIIWKKASCMREECKSGSLEHWWSLPFSCSFGLSSECYHCGKFREIKVEKI